MLLAPTAAAMIIALALIISSFISLRIVSILRSIHATRRKRRQSTITNPNNASSTTTKTSQSSSQVKTAVFLGSGGHTTEMIQLLQHLDHQIYAPVVYIVAESDVTSIPRLQRYIRSSSNDVDDIEGCWKGRYPQSITTTTTATSTASTTTPPKEEAQVHTLPRAREVHQSYTSSIFTTLYSTFKTLQLLWKIRPQLILTNGPGTCVPILYCAFVLRVVDSFVHFTQKEVDQQHPSSSMENTTRMFRTIFIESLCRVKTLSLSGKLVYYIVDSFVVHWPSLMEGYDMVEICDVLVPSLDS